MKTESIKNYMQAKAGWEGLFILLWTMALCCCIYNFSIREGGAASWDGFERCAWGANIWHDIRHLDLAELWRHTNEQVVWPFLHSWITGFLFLLSGPSLASARLFSLFCFGATAFLVWFWFFRTGLTLYRPYFFRETLKQHFSPDYHSGAFTAFMLFTSSPMVVQHSAGIMSELPGLFLVVLVLFLIPQGNEKNERFWIPPAAFLSLLFLYKYNFACLTYMGIFISRLFQEKGRFWNIFNKRDGILFGLPLVILFLWFIPHFSEKVEGFIGFALNNPAARTPMSLSSLLFYPTRIPSAYFPHASIAVLSLIVLFAGSFYSSRICVKNPLVTCFLIHTLAAVMHPMKDIRFMFIPMGLYYVMVGETVFALSKKWVFERSVQRGIALIILGILIVLTFLYQKETYTQPHVSQDQAYQAPLRVIVDQVEREDRTAFLVSHDWMVPPAISFTLIANRDMIQRTKAGSKRWDFLYLFLPMAAFEEHSRDYWLKDLRYRLFAMDANQIITVETTASNKILRFDTLFAGTHAMTSMVDSLHEFTLQETRAFERMDLRIQRYTLKNH